MPATAPNTTPAPYAQALADLQRAVDLQRQIATTANDNRPEGDLWAFIIAHFNRHGFPYMAANAWKARSRGTSAEEYREALREWADAYEAGWL